MVTQKNSRFSTFISKQRGTGLITWFVRNRYFFEQGGSVIRVFDQFSIVNILAGVAFFELVRDLTWRSVLGGGLVCAYYLASAIWRWTLGKVWHECDGYTVETEWNRDKVPPGRVMVVSSKDQPVVVRYANE